MWDTVFRSEELPATERFDQWCAMAEQVMVGEFRCEDPVGFHMSFRAGRLGAVRLTTLESHRLQVSRNARRARQDDVDLLQIDVVFDGDKQVAHAGHETSMRRREVMLSTTARPYQGRLCAERNSVLVARFPACALPMPRARAERLLGRALPGDSGIGALITDYLTRLAHDPSGFDGAADGVRLGMILTDLTGALVAHELEAEDALTPESRRTALVLQIRAFIDEHLGDPMLTPRTVAAAHHISPRYLHCLFKDQDTTVAAWIRRRRLERCRRDLGDPSLVHRPIGAIAARWGFSHAADFSRAFRTAYGLSPSDYRQAVSEASLPQPPAEPALCELPCAVQPAGLVPVSGVRGPAEYAAS
ncbi:helix-turn-helix domain-containing protein [Streptomyces capparidis]